MGALNRKLVRDLWHIRGQAVAIALVIGCGLAVFVMALGIIDSLEETRGAYYERYRFADVFASVKRAPEHLVERISRLPGVEAVATRIVKDVTLDVPGLDEPATGRLNSLPERRRPVLNDIVLRIGRWVSAGRPDEAVISEPFAEAHDLAPGDHLSATINGRKRQLQVVGVALSPEYVYAIAPGALMPDDLRFGVLWMGREALAAAFDLDGAFNDVSLALRRDGSTPEVIARLDRLLEPYGGLGAYDRGDQISNWFLSGEIEQLKTMASFLPTIFLAVAAFLLHMIVSRLVATEREQIGLLKAFGYSNAAVGWHYLKLVLAMAALGLVAGLLSGAWLGRAITELYAEIYRFPFLYYRPSPGVYAAAALVSAAAAVIGTLGAVGRAVALPPAEAMRPPPPPMYRLGMMRAMALDQPSRMILRHMARWPLRTGLTTLGISLAVAVLVTNLHWLDAIEHMVEVYFFDTNRQHVTVTLVEARGPGAVREIERLPGVLVVEPFRSVPVRLRLGQRERRGSIIGIPAEPDLGRVLDADGRPVAIPATGLLLSKTLAELLGARRGTVLTVEAMEGRRPTRQVRVADLFETYLGTPAYMQAAALNRLMLEGPTVSGAHLLTDPKAEPELYRELKDTPAVASVTLQSAAVASFRETLAETLYVIVFFYILFGGLLAFGVVYNSARIALSERGRELASLRVLGFTRFEVSYILLGELALLTLIALPLGCLIGYGLSAMISEAMNTELYRIPMVIDRSTYGVAMLVTVLAVAISSLVVRRRIDRLDLVAVLKTRE